MIQCDIWGCDQDAEYIDEFGNFTCEDCMKKEIADGMNEPEDYEVL